MARYKVKMSKERLRVQFFVGIVFIIIGLFVMLMMLRMGLLFGVLFLMVWTSFAGLETYRAYKGTSTYKGMSYLEIESEINDESLTLDYEERLRKLENLKKDGLITDAEYLEKRKEMKNEEY